MTKSLDEISEMMRDIDLCTLSTVAHNGAIAARPMSNNREVAWDGDAWFFTSEDTAMVPEIEARPQVGVTYQGGAGLKALVGKPGPFIHVEADAEIVRDRSLFAEHWHKELDDWFAQGIDTPGLVAIHAHARDIHYWDGMEAGRVSV